MKNISQISKLVHYKKGAKYLLKLMKFVIPVAIALISRINSLKIILSTMKYQKI